MAQLREEIVAQAVACKLLSERQVAQCKAGLPAGASVEALVSALIKAQALTRWQVKQLHAGKSGGFLVSHYKLLDPLGAGAMGQVFRAADLNVPGRQVAVKLLPRQSATPAAVSRFRREGAAALQLQHAHIVRCFELGQHGKTHFLVMELVDGATLKDYIARHGQLSVQETARIGHEVSLALEHAWQQQIVHRDIKPANILLTRDNRVKLADLGLAKFFGPQGDSQSLATQTGMLMGTLDYLAPEQAEDAKRADIRSDLYSLGCTLYHCLTGAAPFASGTEVQKIMAHREQLPQPIGERNKAVENLFADIIEKRLLAKRPEDRYQTPAEVAMALEPWLGGASRAFNVLDLLEEVVQQDAASATPLAAPAETQHGWDTYREHQRQGQTGPLTTRPVNLRWRVEHAGRAIGLTSLRDTLIAVAAVVAVALALAGLRYWQRGDDGAMAQPASNSPASSEVAESASKPPPPVSDSGSTALPEQPAAEAINLTTSEKTSSSQTAASARSDVLPAPQHTSPAVGADVAPTTGFHWSDVSGAARYTIEFAFFNPASGQWDLATSITTTGPALEDPSARLKLSTPSRRGAWRVWAYDSSGKEGHKSQWSEFRIAPASPDASEAPAAAATMPALPKIRGLMKRYPGIEATASSEWSGWPVTNLLDGNLETSWFSAKNESAAMKKGPWFEVHFPQAIIVRRVAVWGCREPAYLDARLAVLEGRVLLLDAQHKRLDSGTAKSQGRDLEFVFEPAVSAVRYVRFVSLWDEGNRNEFGDIALGEVQIE